MMDSPCTPATGNGSESVFPPYDRVMALAALIRAVMASGVAKDSIVKARLKASDMVVTTVTAATVFKNKG